MSLKTEEVRIIKELKREITFTDSGDNNLVVISDNFNEVKIAAPTSVEFTPDEVIIVAEAIIELAKKMKSEEELKKQK